jgi:ubiquinone/menaquinone biosynthesis C-methylase UbiE
MAGLSRAEKSILKRVSARLPSMDMLNLGVGAGRTTKAFASLARKYVGVDFASPMVEACRARYPGLDFRVADARDLTIFPDESFDFPFFGQNLRLQTERGFSRSGSSTHTLFLQKRAPARGQARF